MSTTISTYEVFSCYSSKVANGVLAALQSQYGQDYGHSFSTGIDFNQGGIITVWLDCASERSDDYLSMLATFALGVEQGLLISAHV